jgi:hypothetical protein
MSNRVVTVSGAEEYSTVPDRFIRPDEKEKGSSF